MLVRMRRKGNPCVLLVGISIGVVIMKNSMEVPQKIKNRTTVKSNNPILGHISIGNDVTISKGFLHSHVHCSVIHDSQDMETT